MSRSPSTSPAACLRTTGSRSRSSDSPPRPSLSTWRRRLSQAVVSSNRFDPLPLAIARACHVPSQARARTASLALSDVDLESTSTCWRCTLPS
eukprot:4641964-Pleurochrysis_carterae.AAC.2